MSYLKSPTSYLKYGGFVLLFHFFFSQSALATNIQKLFDDLKVGDRIQVKVVKNAAGELVADRIQIDKTQSKPKIRAVIQNVSKPENTIEILGLKIKVSEKTETDLKKNVNLWEALKPGQRVEVKIRIQEDSVLKATRILTKKIKVSDKIEAYIQEKIKGGSEYFFIKLLGLKIKVDSGTDVLEEISEVKSPLEQRLVDVDETRPLSRINLWNFLNVQGGIEWNLTPERNYQRYDTSNLLNKLNGNFNDNLVSTGILIDLELTGKYHKKLESFTKVRFFGSHPLLLENRIRPDGRARFQIREAYVVYRDIFNLPFGFKIGRQDFDESREWLYDHNLDAARLYLYPLRGWVTEFSVVLGSYPQIKKFEKFTDLILYSYWEFIKKNTVGFYLVDRNDKSDSLVQGREQATKPTWYGIRTKGKIKSPITFRYWSELSWLRGERPDKGRKFHGYAFDVGNTFVLNSWWEPSLTVGYAFGSGDPDTVQSRLNKIIPTFEQTDYHDNTDNFNGVATFQYYGEIFDPELSNLRIFTLGVGSKPSQLLSFDLLYHKYRQVELSNKLKDTDLIDPLLIPPSSKYSSRNLGWEADFVAGIEKLRNFDFKLVISYFKPGEAFFFKDTSTWHSRLAVEFNF